MQLPIVMIFFELIERALLRGYISTEQRPGNGGQLLKGEGKQKRGKRERENSGGAEFSTSGSNFEKEKRNHWRALMRAF